MSPRGRDPFLCAAGSFFFPGLGQVYCGRILRGLVFLIPAILLQAINPVNYLLRLFDLTNDIVMLTSWSMLMILASSLVDFIVRAIATYDAYKIAKSPEAVVQSYSNL